MATKSTNRNRTPEELKGAVTKSQFKENKAAQASAAADVAREAEQRRTAPKAPATYGTDFGGKEDLHPARYPNAISHDAVFHDQLATHISNLRARLDSAVTSGSNPVMKINKQVQSHLNKAEEEMSLSWAAHKAGTERGVEGIHTAVEAYRRAHQHVSNAHRVLVNGLGGFGSGKGSLKTLQKHFGENSDLPLLTSTQRENLVKDYSNHVRSISQKKGVALPEGVAVDKKTNLSDVDAPEEVLRPGAAYSRKLSGRTPKSDAEIATGKAQRVFNQGLMRLQTAGSAGTRTLGQVEGARRAAQEGVAIDPFKLPETVGTAHAGVGITGFNTLATAAKNHYEYHNPGQKWSESVHSKDPVAYAVKHRVSFPSQEATTAKVLRNMGLDQEEDNAGTIVRGSYKEKAEKPVGREIPLSTAVNTKPSRSSEFKTGGNK
jgi:hypothetical protein